MKRIYLLIFLIMSIFICSCNEQVDDPKDEKPETSTDYGFIINGNNNPSVGEMVKYSVKFNDVNYSNVITWSVSDKSIAVISSSGNANCKISFIKAGNVTIIAEDEQTKERKEYQVMVSELKHSIYYDVEDELIYMPNDYPTDFSESDLPLELPMMSGKENYFFMGWKIVGTDNIINTLGKDEYDEEVRLLPVWNYPYIEANFESYPLIRINERLDINLNEVGFPAEYKELGYDYTVSDNSIIEVIDDQVVGLKAGSAYVNVTLKGVPNVTTSFGIIVVSDMNKVSDAEKFIISTMKENIIYEYIMVYGWQEYYRYDMIKSVSNYLFEDFTVNENIAPLTIAARPGTKKQKYYICVHDTGDSVYSAEEWSNIVHAGAYSNGDSYNASFQYVVGNDGIWHNIPDDEVAWHAGDGTQYDYTLLDSGVEGSDKKPVIDISSDGYYTINGVKSKILAPTNDGKILTKNDINDVGILCKLIDGKYYLGRTYYNTTYRKIANYGGNNNSIGIESCINKGSDVHYTWQKLAKLVANLMDQNSLDIDAVVPHHYFSGKNCPMTIRESYNWNYFLGLVETEYKALEYLKQGYKFSITSTDESINDKGRVSSLSGDGRVIKLTLNITNGTNSISYDIYTYMPSAAYINYVKQSSNLD